MGDMVSPTYGIRVLAKQITINLNGHSISLKTWVW